MHSSKIFNLSLHRSATESFSQFLADHGFQAAHWPTLTFDQLCEPAVARLDTARVFQLALETIEANEAFADVPYCFLYPQILNVYPDARYLMILRPVDTWIKSVRRHIGDRALHNLEKLQYWPYLEDRFNHIYDYTDQQLQTVYIRHLKSVVNLAQISRVNFRLFELEQDSLEQTRLTTELAEYLDFSIEAPFPIINVSQERLGT